MLSEISQSEKDKLRYDLTHMWKLRNKTNKKRGKKTQTKKQTLHYREQTDGYQQGGGQGNG